VKEDFERNKLKLEEEQAKNATLEKKLAQECSSKSVFIISLILYFH